MYLENVSLPCNLSKIKLQQPRQTKGLIKTLSCTGYS
jgi:hypothetical protein